LSLEVRVGTLRQLALLVERLQHLAGVIEARVAQR